MLCLSLQILGTLPCKNGHLLSFNIYLRISDTSLRMDKNDSRRKIISFHPHQSILVALLDKIFMFYF
jgi:hypothetical protein